MLVGLCDGLEVLEYLHKHPVFKDIPIVMLTSSKEQQDVDNSFELGISGYILKPVDYEQFISSIQVLNSFWTLKQS